MGRESESGSATNSQKEEEALPKQRKVDGREVPFLFVRCYGNA